MSGCSALVMRVTLGLVFLLTAGTVYAQNEGGDLFGKQKAKVQRCGGGTDSLSWDVVLQPNGDWSADDGVNVTISLADDRFLILRGIADAANVLPDDFQFV